MATIVGPLGIVGTPCDHMRRSRSDFVVAARTAVRLGRRGSRQRPHVPIAVGVALQPLITRRSGSIGVNPSAVLTSHTRAPMRGCGTHGPPYGR